MSGFCRRSADEDASRFCESLKVDVVVQKLTCLYHEIRMSSSKLTYAYHETRMAT